MSFVKRELDRLHDELASASSPSPYAELYIAQQALAWSLDPTGFNSPFNFIMGNRQDAEDCCPEICQVPSSNTLDHCG